MENKRNQWVSCEGFMANDYPQFDHYWIVECYNGSRGIITQVKSSMINIVYGKNNSECVHNMDVKRYVKCTLPEILSWWWSSAHKKFDIGYRAEDIEIIRFYCTEFFEAKTNQKVFKECSSELVSKYLDKFSEKDLVDVFLPELLKKLPEVSKEKVVQVADRSLKTSLIKTIAEKFGVIVQKQHEGILLGYWNLVKENWPIIYRS